MRRLRVAVLIGVVIFGGCLFAPPLPDEYLGRWEAVSQGGGGITGAPSRPASGHILVTERNVLLRFESDGTLTESVPFTVDYGESVYGGEAWILTPKGGLPLVARLYDGGHRMSLSENVYDGTGSTFARSR